MRGLTTEEKQYLLHECKPCSGLDCDDRQFTSQEIAIGEVLERRQLIRWTRCHADTDIHPRITSTGHSVLEMVRLSESSINLMDT